MTATVRTVRRTPKAATAPRRSSVAWRSAKLPAIRSTSSARTATPRPATHNKQPILDPYRFLPTPAGTCPVSWWNESSPRERQVPAGRISAVATGERSARTRGLRVVRRRTDRPHRHRRHVVPRARSTPLERGRQSDQSDGRELRTVRRRGDLAAEAEHRRPEHQRRRRPHPRRCRSGHRKRDLRAEGARRPQRNRRTSRWGGSSRKRFSLPATTRSPSACRPRPFPRSTRRPRCFRSASSSQAYPPTQITATGGAGGNTWTDKDPATGTHTLPAGLAINSLTGVISGTPIFAVRVAQPSSP